MKHTYRFKGYAPHLIPDLGIVAEPGQLVESDVAIKHPDFEPAGSRKAATPKDVKPPKPRKAVPRKPAPPPAATLGDAEIKEVV